MAGRAPSKDRDDAGEKGETIGDWAKLAKISPEELTKQGMEKKQDNLHPGTSSQVMPDWVFDNDFEGRPPPDAKEELKRLDKEMMAIVADLDNHLKQKKKEKENAKEKGKAETCTDDKPGKS